MSNIPELKIEDVMSDLKTVAIFKEFLQTIKSSEYITAWAQVNRLMKTDDLIARIPMFSRFKATFIREDAVRQLFIDYAFRILLEKTKMPLDDLLDTLRDTIVAGLHDGYVQMMSDDKWRKRIRSGPPPRWMKRHSFVKLSRRDSDELLIQCFSEANTVAC